MLDKVTVRKLSDADLERAAGELTDFIALTDRRLSALRRRQARDPDWKALDPLIDEEVGIDVRIEEQEAVRQEAEENLALVDAEKVRRKGRPQAPPPPISLRRYEAERATTPQMRLL